MSHWSGRSRQEFEASLSKQLAHLPNASTSRIRKYVDFKLGHVKPASAHQGSNALRDLAEHLDTRGKTLANAKNADVKAYFAGLTLEDTTRHIRWVHINQYYKWATRKERPPQLVDIKIKRPSGGKITSEDLVTPEELEALMRANTAPTDQALIAVLYEGGPRVGELTDVLARHIRFRTDMPAVDFHIPQGKTGPRDIRLFDALPYLKAVFTSHARRLSDPNARIWVTDSQRSNGKPLTATALSNRVAAFSKSAKIRHINAHRYRHTAATHKAEQGLQEDDLRKFFGWAPGSDMPTRYVHASKDSANNRLTVLRGYATPDAKLGTPKILQQVRCECGWMNISTAIICERCNRGLTEEGRQEEKRLKDQEFQTQLARQLLPLMDAQVQQLLPQLEQRLVDFIRNKTASPNGGQIPGSRPLSRATPRNRID